MTDNIFAQHVIYLTQALHLAGSYRGFCAPNPAVGAVVVHQEHGMVGSGAHVGCGQPHAEILALQQAGKLALGATLYATLEPCSHFGRTPPCTQAIVAAGIQQVIYGFRDPNDHVEGDGHACLVEAGIQTFLLCLPAIQTFYRSYRHWLATGFPWVTAKLALSSNAKIAGRRGRPIRISGEKANRLTHQFRYSTDAILTTSKTVMQDNPRLDARLHKKTRKLPIYILNSRAHPLSLYTRSGELLQLLTTASSMTLFCSEEEVDHSCHEQLQAQGITCFNLPYQDDLKRLSAKEALRYIGQQGHHDVWVEAGGCCFFTLLKQNLMHRGLFYIASSALGEDALCAAPDHPDMDTDRYTCSWSLCGDDVIFDFSIKEGNMS